MEERRRLTTWKEIAGHLGVSTRTAQKLEQEEGLPVHRFAQNSTVFAYVGEINEWTRSRASERGDRSASPSPQTRGSSLFQGWLLLAVLLLACAVLLAWYLVARKPGVPVLLELKGSSVLALDAERRVLWKKDFTDLDLSFYHSQVQAAANWYFLLPDAVGAGSGRVVIVVADSGMHPRFLGFNFEGEQIWEAALSVDLEWNGEEISSTYAPRLAGLLRVGGEERIFGVSVNIPRFSALTVIVDPFDGRITGKYAHPGHFTSFLAEDFDGDGSDELLLGGVNNPGPGEGHAAVVLLDVPPEDPVFGQTDFFGQPALPTLAYLLFPRPAVKEALRLQSVVTEIWDAGEGMWVINVAGPREGESFGVFYTFDRRLKLQRVQVDDEFRRSYRHLWLEGRLPGPLDENSLVPLGTVLQLSQAPNGNDPEVAALFQSAPLCDSGEIPCREVSRPF